ncbi:MAG TPA: hypothetical protein VMM77_08600 [Gemmatimonadaceae bacterium]|nr:hypothetical protein [Gemmatimonadaceae bacterium]
MAEAVRQMMSRTGSIAAAAALLAACGGGDRGAVGDTAVTMTGDTSAATVSSGVSRVRMREVNRGSSGMAAQVRWALSADQRAIIVVEDPASVENEPFPNGFVLARETAAGVEMVQLDSVWDAAPSPDWSAAAFGRAHRVSAGERDSLTTAQWDSLARAAGMPNADVRRGAFPASGMAVIIGLSQPGIIRLHDGTPRVWPVAAGWRVAWSRDGERIAAGMPPTPRVSDDADSPRWIVIDTASGMPRGELPPDFERFVPNWVQGPLIDISVSHDTAQRVSLQIDGGTVESSGNRITRNGVEVGAGIAYAATRSGRIIVALAPDPSAGEYEPKERLVVYIVEP